MPFLCVLMKKHDHGSLLQSRIAVLSADTALAPHGCTKQPQTLLGAVVGQVNKGRIECRAKVVAAEGGKSDVLLANVPQRTWESDGSALHYGVCGCTGKPGSGNPRRPATGPAPNRWAWKGLGRAGWVARGRQTQALGHAAA